MRFDEDRDEEAPNLTIAFDRDVWQAVTAMNQNVTADELTELVQAGAAGTGGHGSVDYGDD